MLRPESACLLIADISGYTGYLAGVELDHAHDILADLIGTVVSSLRPAFRLTKLEGDAAFTYALAETVDGSLLLDTIERCYFGFRRRRRDVRQATSCPCNACIRIPDLGLKFAVHHGSVLRQRIAGREELVGSDVILAHRLLKNEVVRDTGVSAYALFTDACTKAMGIDPGVLGMVPVTENYDHLGEVSAWVHDLERRWQEEEQRQRVYVEPADAIYEMEARTSASPQVAWAYLTTPGRRLGWQAGVTAFEVSAPGNRRGVGATNHCMHGEDAVVEEILDWRPYDYYSDRSTMETPVGRLRFVSTREVEPTPDGSIVRMRVGRPKSAKDRAVLEQLRPMIDGLVKQSYANLRRDLDAAAIEEREAS